MDFVDFKNHPSLPSCSFKGLVSGCLQTTVTSGTCRIYLSNCVYLQRLTSVLGGGVDIVGRTGRQRVDPPLSLALPIS